MRTLGRAAPYRVYVLDIALPNQNTAGQGLRVGTLEK